MPCTASPGVSGRQAKRSKIVVELKLAGDEIIFRDSDSEEKEVIFPFPLEHVVRVLGVLFDDLFTIDDQFARMLTKAQVRQGILSKVAGMR